MYIYIYMYILLGNTLFDQWRHLNLYTKTFEFPVHVPVRIFGDTGGSDTGTYGRRREFESNCETNTIIAERVDK